MEPIFFLNTPSSPIDNNIKKLLNFYDIEFKVIDRDDNIANGSCLFLNCGILKDGTFNSSFKNFLLSKFSYIFLYNLSVDSSKAIEWLTEGDIRVSCNNKKNTLYQICNDNPKICKQLSGLSFQANAKKEDFVFNFNDILIKSLIKISDKPYFIKFNKKNCELFAVANQRIIDIDKNISSEFNLSTYFPDFVPILLFLKYALKKKFWHTSDRYACFIIDDPLLCKNYGFLNYKKLLSLMEKHNFCTNISFIPYNYQRSDQEVIRLFKKHDDRFSTTIHGCDHTEAEFGTTNEKELNRKIKLALKRMESHKNLTEINYDRVMIFPQGVFSSISLKLLKANNFLGTINSTAFPNDLSKLQIADFFSPAMIKYSCFPLFLRKYPVGISELALNLFMDKPLFLVEHHTFFKNGYRGLSEFIDRINNNFPRIKWKSPEYILNNFYLKRRCNECNYLKIFTNNTIIKNDSNKSEKFHIVKNEDSEIPIKKIMIGNQESEYIIRNNQLNFQFEIPPKEQVDIKIYYQNCFGTGRDPGFKIKCKVKMRRFLTEFRDKYISKNEILYKIASKTKNLLKKFVA